jgi:hypothetical protein
VPKAGETQLQAKLVKIECEAKGIVFVVQTATGLLRLRTKTFDDIEITTYDPERRRRDHVWSHGKVPRAAWCVLRAA